MREIVFVAVGGLGFLLIVLFGHRLLHNPETSSKQFAVFLSGSFAILGPALALLTHPIDTSWIIFCLIWAAIHFGVGYPIAYFFHRTWSNRRVAQGAGINRPR